MNDIKYVIDGFKSLKPILQAQVLKTDYEGLGVSDAEELGEHFNIAIKCMEKQIPKKPIKINSVEFKGSIRMSFKSADCPVCGGHIDTDDEPFFCSHSGCGQAIDWSV